MVCNLASIAVATWIHTPVTFTFTARQTSAASAALDRAAAFTWQIAIWSLCFISFRLERWYGSKSDRGICRCKQRVFKNPGVLLFHQLLLDGSPQATDMFLPLITLAKRIALFRLAAHFGY